MNKIALEFEKWHGCGNDFIMIVLDESSSVRKLPDQIVAALVNNLY